MTMILGLNLKKDTVYDKKFIQQSCHVKVSFYAFASLLLEVILLVCNVYLSKLIDVRKHFEDALNTSSKSLCYHSARLCLYFATCFESWMLADLIWLSGLSCYGLKK